MVIVEDVNSCKNDNNQEILGVCLISTSDGDYIDLEFIRNIVA